MALITTFATTPLTAALYPPWYQKKLEAWKRGEIDWDTGKPIMSEDSSARDSLTFEKVESNGIHRLLVYLRLDNMPTLLAFLALMGDKSSQTTNVTASHPSQPGSEVQTQLESTTGMTSPKKPLVAHGMRLLELTERDSSVMKVAEMEEYSLHDPVVNTFRTFGNLNAVGVSGEVAITPQSGFAEALTTKASDVSADLLLLPWTETGSISETLDIVPQRMKQKLQAPAYTSFVESALLSAPCNVAVFISKNFGGVRAPPRPTLSRSYSTTSLRSRQGIADAQMLSLTDRTHHIFFPFFGGADDRAALKLLMQIATNSEVTVTTVFYQAPEHYFQTAESSQILPASPTKLTPTRSFTGFSGKAPAMDTSDDHEPSEKDTDLFSSLRSSLPESVASRVKFESVKTNTPFKDALERTELEVGQRPRNAGDLVVVGRNFDKNSTFAMEVSLESKVSADAIQSSSPGPLGYMAETIVSKGISASVLVLQAQAKSM